MNEEGDLSLDELSPAVKSAFSVGNQELDLSTYLDLDNHDVLMALKAWRSSTDPILADLARRLLDRQLLKPIEVETLPFGIEADLRDIMRRTGFDPNYYLLHDRASDVAYDYYTVDEDGKAKLPIFLLQKEGQRREISSLSSAIQAIARQPRSRLVLYVPQECRAAIVELLSMKG